jgi:hypothetical protein
MDVKKIIFTTGLMALAAGVTAQSPVDGSHYPAGLNGLKGGSAPGPGLYFRDDNLFYSGNGGQLANYSTFVYLQAPQLLWMTGWTFLGANFGMDLTIPLEYRDASYNLPPVTTPGGGFSVARPVSDSQFGLGDIELEPLILAWHWQHFDTTVGYSLWVPSGHFTGNRLANLGDDEWTHMISLGGVWYPDEKKTWAFSLLHHFEMNASQVGTLFTSSPGGGYPSTTYPKISCSTYTLEWGVSKTILDHTDVGIFGYYQKQFSDGNPAFNPFSDSEVAGIGPEISATIPRWNLTASVRYAYEFTAYHRPEGHTVNLTLTKKF